MARARTLTARTVETIKPAHTRQEIPDRHMPGLYLVVQPSGAKSWAARYRIGGRTRKLTLGSYPAIDLKAARALAGKAMRAAAEGRDPAIEKAQARMPQPDTVEAIARLFVERYCLHENRPSTVASARQMLSTYVLWRNRLLHTITRYDVHGLLDSVVDAGKPIMANRVLAVVRKMCNWAVERGIITASPCVGVRKPTKEDSRDRVLTDEELANVLHAADRLGGPFGTMVMLLVLTGQRRDEVARMRWSEIDVADGLWRLPAERVKNGRAHDVPLSQAVLDVVAALPRIADSDFVLTTVGAVPMNGYSKGKRQFDALLPADMSAWRLHDLRRTVATGLQRLGIRLEVTEAVLNHVSGSRAGIAGVYQRHDFAGEKRAALEAWSRHVLTLSPNRTAPKAVNA